MNKHVNYDLKKTWILDTTWKVSVFSRSRTRNTPNTDTFHAVWLDAKNRPETLRIRTLFTQYGLMQTKLVLMFLLTDCDLHQQTTTNRLWLTEQTNWEAATLSNIFSEIFRNQYWGDSGLMLSDKQCSCQLILRCPK